MKKILKPWNFVTQPWIPPFNAARNWGKGRSHAAAKRRRIRDAAENYEKNAGHGRDGRIIRPILANRR